METKTTCGRSIHPPELVKMLDIRCCDRCSIDMSNKTLHTYAFVNANSRSAAEAALTQSLRIVCPNALRVISTHGAQQLMVICH
jgi:hypothetical protein